MLSCKNPQDPSCSSKLPVARGGESAFTKVSLQERDLILEEEKSAPKFSIRDYVFSSRNKGTETNWPFKKHFLQLFLNHGVKDPLPPFEPPGLVRIQCQRKGVQPLVGLEVEEIIAYSDTQAKAAVSTRQDSCSLLEKSTPSEKLINCQRISNDDLVHYDPDIDLISTDDEVGKTYTVSGGFSSSLSKNRGLSEVPSVVNNIKITRRVDSSCKPLEKKCRFIFKLGGISKNNRTEDKSSNSSPISDPMASKVCPVCKTFSSTSNTTLNAHIDQCLSMESYDKCASSNFLKPKVRREKKKLMVDIYATAPHCTLEDLDRRNGTNWAIELAYLVAPFVEAGTEIKKPKLVRVDSRGDDNAAVYIDSNCIKHGIVSNLNGTQQLKDEVELQENATITGTSKNIKISKKMDLSAKYSKMTKAKVQKKKLSAFMVSNSQIQTESEGDQNLGALHVHGESLSYVTEPGSLAKTTRSASLKQWVRTRRSNHLRNLESKTNLSASDDTVPLTRSRLAESSRPSVCNSSVSTSQRLKIVGLSEGSAGSLRTNKIELITKTVHFMDDAMKKPKKLSISTSGRSYETMTEKSALRRTYIPPKICHSSSKNGIVEALKKNESVRKRSFNIVSRTCNLSADLSTSSTFRKYRSFLRSGKNRAQISVDFPGASEQVSSEIDDSKSVTLSSERESVNHSSPLRKDVPGSEKRDDWSTIMEEQQHSTLKMLNVGTDFHDYDVENLDMNSRNHVGKPAKEIAVVNPPVKIGFQFKFSTMVEHSQPISESDAHEDQLINMSDKQVAFSNDASREETDAQSTEVAIEMEESREKDSFVGPPTECEFNTAPVQESSDCLTSHGQMQLDITQKCTLVTSSITTSNDAMDMVADGEPCGSVVSTASTISLHSPKHPKYTDSNNEKLGSAIISQNTLCMAFPNVKDNIGAEERNLRIRNQKLNVELPERVLDQSLDDKLFCCSCRENHTRDSQIFGQSDAYGSDREKQVANLFSRPRVSSSISLYQNRRTDTTINYDLQSSAQSTPSQSQNQLISTPVLRLMGKNLMVVNNQEVLQPSNTCLDNPSHESLLLPLEFASISSHLKQKNFQHHANSLGRPPTFETTVPMADFSVTSSHNAYSFIHRPNNRIRQKNEVILTDDFSDTENEMRASLCSPTMSALPVPVSGLNPSPQTFSYFSSQCHISDLPRPPVSRNPYISINASLTGRASTSECHGPPVLSNQFLLQSPTTAHMRTI